MSEEVEIEFLDEDADIVQQCVQNVESNSNMVENDLNTHIIDTQLLVERVQDKQEKSKQEKSKKKRKREDDDSDYDPTEDIVQRGRKRRQFVKPNITRGRRIDVVQKPDLKTKRDPFDTKITLENRRKLKLRIPDYNDPLCLPVRALRKDDGELRKLKNWNKLCLEHFKNYDTLLRVEKQPSISSVRSVVLRNVHNKSTGRVETTMYSKLCIQNINGDKKNEVVQSVLPKFREKKLLNNFRLLEQKKRKVTPFREEVILTNEVDDDVENLVVYKPNEALSLVYKMFEKQSTEIQSGNEEDDQKYIQEVACCKICALCYQASWRTFNESNSKKIICAICDQACFTMYNFLEHLKSHPDSEVRRQKKSISRSLSAVRESHYKCRICEEKFQSIKELRQHVRIHRGTEVFKCVICDKFTN